MFSLSRARSVGLIGSIVVALVILALALDRSSSLSVNSTDHDSAETLDPRLTFATPFQNVRPDVKYVGDASCVDCHADIAARYARHPMGRSMALTQNNVFAETLTKKSNNPFEKFGSLFRVEVRDQNLFHREERRDSEGHVVAATECEARYAIGSGTRGISYLVDHDGRLFQSPISWFGEKKTWDTSPGFSESRRFNRPIIPRCVYCHANLTEPVDGTLNQYHAPTFRGLSIGCERCHGPGELHVKSRETNEQMSIPDYTIVNPKHLKANAREAVCQQCHLQGSAIVLPRGRSEYDFRPGLPLEMFRAVFIRRPELAENYRSVGQVEQMTRSRCYTGSDGRLGCISCHDPHERPEPAQRVTHYRDRCLNCHQDRGCSIEETVRRREQPEDSCMACHMVKDASRNIPHTAVTDHRILRRPDTRQRDDSAMLRSVTSPLIPFHASSTHISAKDLDRCHGLALADTLTGLPRSAASVVGGLALAPLEQAIASHPNDAPVWEARGAALTATGRVAEARESYLRALELYRESEAVRIALADTCVILNRIDEAIEHLKQVIQINPYVPSYHLSLARLEAQRSNWTRGREGCETALRLEPVNLEARMLLVTCLVRLGDEKRAQVEFDKLLAMQPSNEADLQRVYKLLIE